MLVTALESAASKAKERGLSVCYEFVETTSPGRAIASGAAVTGSASHMARRAAEGGADVVAAAGGDGTVGEVVNGLIGSPAALAVLPMGTGNDFARSLGIGNDLNIAAEALAYGNRRRVDVGKCNDGYFINVAGCGFDAEVAWAVNHGFRRLRGTAAYLAGVLKTLASFRPFELSLQVDGTEYRTKAMLVAVANAQMYGGGMKVAPNADFADGLFDVVVVRDMSKLAFLRAFPNVFKGTHITHPRVAVYRGRSVRIAADRPVQVLADGEEVGQTPATFDLVERAIDVMVPASES